MTHGIEEKVFLLYQILLLLIFFLLLLIFNKVLGCRDSRTMCREDNLSGAARAATKNMLCEGNILFYHPALFLCSHLHNNKI
jgi:hypothetical protein